VGGLHLVEFLAQGGDFGVQRGQQRFNRAALVGVDAERDQHAQQLCRRLGLDDAGDVGGRPRVPGRIFSPSRDATRQS
jgi:hypothetical protein